MNILAQTGNSVFTADGSTDQDFYCLGEVTMEVPTSHKGNTEDLGGGTLALQVTTDDGISYRTYTDTLGNAATLDATGEVLAATFPGKTRCRLNLASSTSPDVTAVILSGMVSMKLD